MLACMRVCACVRVCVCVCVCVDLNTNFFLVCVFQLFDTYSKAKLYKFRHPVSLSIIALVFMWICD